MVVQLTLTSLSFSFTLGLVNAMGSRMVLNLRKQGAIEGTESPPVNVHFIDARNSYAPRDADNKYLGMLQSRVHQPYGDMTRVVKPAEPPQAKKQDPFFHERRAYMLRTLKASRPGTGKSSPRSAPHTPRSQSPVARHNLSAIICDPPNFDAKPKAWSDINSTTSETPIVTEDDDSFFDMELLPVPPPTATIRGAMDGRYRFPRNNPDSQRGPSSHGHDSV